MGPNSEYSSEHRPEPQSAPTPVARCIDCGSVFAAADVLRHFVTYHPAQREIYINVTDGG